MAFFCPKSIKGCAIRVTRQNDCGQALDPLTPNSRYQAAGFMELTMKPDIEKGEDITDKNACGDICIRDKDCDRLKGFDVELKMCGIPLPLVEMLLDATLLDDADNMGDFKGAVLRESKAAACAPPKQIEVWSKNSNRAQCLSSSGQVANVWVQWLLPFTRNWEISGDLAFNTKSLMFTVTGYAENNPNWVPSWPSPTEDFPSYVLPGTTTPSLGDPDGIPVGTDPVTLPTASLADTWTTGDQTDIQAGGPLAWQGVSALPAPLEACNYTGVQTSS